MVKEKIPIKFPGGYRGIILQAHNEQVQDTVFLPTDGILVAVNQEGDPEYGTVVVDLNDKNEIDTTRVARLQTAWRVIKKPLFQPNTLALQLNQEGKGKGFGGYVIDTGADTEDLVIGRLSSVFGGFIDVGSPKDKHFQGKDGDGRSINPAHITTRALFRRSNLEDGPLRFESDYKEGNDGSFVHPVHLAWTGVDWAWYVKVNIGDTPTLELLKPRPLKKPVLGFPQGEFLRPGVPTPGSPGRPGGGGPPPLPPVETPGTVRPSTPTVTPLQALEMCNEMATPGVLARPQTSNPKKIDLAHVPSGGLTDAARNQMNETPISGQMMAFGAQGGDKGIAYPNAEVMGASGDPWIYTQRPKKSKFYGGTCSGGFVILPPEVVAGDAANGYAPPNIERSVTYFLTGPGAWFGAGIPELVDGSIQDGWSWGMDEATGDLLFRSHALGAVPENGIKFIAATQDFAWASGTGFWATLSHAHTADRTHTFMDVSAYVASLLFGSGDPNGSVTAPEGTFYWDTDGDALYVNDNGTDTWTTAGGGAPLSDDDPLPIGPVADPGVSNEASRADHVHPGAPVETDKTFVLGDIAPAHIERSKTDADVTTTDEDGVFIDEDDLEIFVTAPDDEDLEVTVHLSGTLGMDAGFETDTQVGIGVDDGEGGATSIRWGGHATTYHFGDVVDFPFAQSGVFTIPAGEQRRFNPMLRRLGGFDSAVARIDSDHPFIISVDYIEKTYVEVVEDVDASGGGAPLSDDDPLPDAAVADPGVSNEASRADHVHPSIASDDDPLPDADAADPGASEQTSRADHVHPSIVQVQGDILARNATGPVALPIGDHGQTLIVDDAETTKQKWVWGAGLWGLGMFGTGCDGSLSCGAGTTTLAAGIQGRHYTTITLASGATLRNATGSNYWGIVLYASEYIDGADSTSIITTQGTNYDPTAGAGGAGSGGGGSGGDAGIMRPNIWIYAKHFTGSGLINGDGNPGADGADGTSPTTTNSGAAGTRPAASGIRLWNTLPLGPADLGVGGGGVSTGAAGSVGGTGAGWTEYDLSNVRDVANFMTFYGPINYSSSSTANWTRAFKLTGGSGGGAGGRSTTTGAGGGSSAAGPHAWPSVPGSEIPQTGSPGGAGTAGGAGSGGGAGGIGATGTLIYIMTLTMAAGWTVRSRGGDGGDGGDGFGWGGGGAGANGGEGGWIIILSPYGVEATFDVSGGLKGVKGVHGASGGNDGTDGKNGRAGIVWDLVGMGA